MPFHCNTFSAQFGQGGDPVADRHETTAGQLANRKLDDLLGRRKRAVGRRRNTLNDLLGIGRPVEQQGRGADYHSLVASAGSAMATPAVATPNRGPPEAGTAKAGTTKAGTTKAGTTETGAAPTGTTGKSSTKHPCSPLRHGDEPVGPTPYCVSSSLIPKGGMGVKKLDIAERKAADEAGLARRRACYYDAWPVLPCQHGGDE